MTTGSKYWGSRSVATEPFYAQRIWNGGNDQTNRKAWTALELSLVNKSSSWSERSNPYWPFTPPSYASYHLSEPTIIGWLPVKDNAELECLNKLAAEIRGHDFHAGVFVGESLESLRMLVNSVRTAIELLNAVKRLDAATVLRTVARVTGTTPGSSVKSALRRKDISAVWLSIQYGWKPLVSDVQEAIKAYKTFGEKQREVRFKASKSDKPWTVNLSIDPANYYAPGIVQSKVVYTMSLKENLSTMHRLGLNDLNSVAWELVPFSFVVDWFIPIGDYISTTAFFRGLSFTYMKTTIQVINFDYPCTKLPPPNNTLWVQLGRQKGRMVRVNRTLGSDLIMPLPKMKAMEKAFSTGHILNAAALINGMIGGHKAIPVYKPRLGAFST